MSEENKTFIFERRTPGTGEGGVPDALKAILRVIGGGKNAGQEFRVTNMETVLGRGDQVDIHIDDDSMSRRHAVVSFRNLEFRIRDLGSSNGTYLNGSEVKEYALRNGDKLLMGETMFQFVIDRA